MMKLSEVSKFFLEDHCNDYPDCKGCPIAVKVEGQQDDLCTQLSLLRLNFKMDYEPEIIVERKVA